ncbi:15473_t:CDS:2, partial [Funneliformis mosseae]
PSIKKVLEEFKKMGFGIDDEDEDNSTYEYSAPIETEISIKNISAEEQTNELNRLLDTHDDLIKYSNIRYFKRVNAFSNFTYNYWNVRIGSKCLTSVNSYGEISRYSILILKKPNL